MSYDDMGIERKEVILLFSKCEPFCWKSGIIHKLYQVKVLPSLNGMIIHKLFLVKLFEILVEKINNKI